jgi:hypothetical protein
MCPTLLEQAYLPIKDDEVIPGLGQLEHLHLWQLADHSPYKFFRRLLQTQCVRRPTDKTKLLFYFMFSRRAWLSEPPGFYYQKSAAINVCFLYSGRRFVSGSAFDGRLDPGGMDCLNPLVLSPQKKKKKKKILTWQPA